MSDTGTAQLLLYRSCRRGCRVCVGYPLRRGSEGQALYKLKCRKQQLYDLAADYGIQLPPARKVAYSQSNLCRRLKFCNRSGVRVEVVLAVTKLNSAVLGTYEQAGIYGAIKASEIAVIALLELQKRGITIVCR